MTSELVLLLQGGALLWFLGTTTIRLLLSLPAAVLQSLWGSLMRGPQQQGSHCSGGCVFYEGTVSHVRAWPIRNAFRYLVRMAVVDLDRPPAWWSEQASDHLTAAAARQFAGTDGSVALLTTPVSAGYAQNPISVYYCRDSAACGGDLKVCIAEVTNTPWGARVTFLFDPAGQDVPKSMHVSPFMDMQATWRLQTELPGEEVRLSVAATHPEHGAFFSAQLAAARSGSGVRSEASDLSRLWRYGYMPHRVAFWIYWQAVRLLWLGLPFHGYPPAAAQDAAEAAARNPSNTRGSHFAWQSPLCFPWNLACVCMESA